MCDFMVLPNKKIIPKDTVKAIDCYVCKHKSFFLPTIDIYLSELGVEMDEFVCTGSVDHRKISFKFDAVDGDDDLSMFNFNEAVKNLKEQLGISQYRNCVRAYDSRDGA